MGKALVGTCDYNRCSFVGTVTSAHIIIDGQEWAGDLCPEHLHPLQALIKASTRRKPTGRNRVYTLEEIEALKRGEAP